MNLGHRLRRPPARHRTDVCAPVAHRQVVLTIVKRLRLHARFDRKLLGQLCTCAWICIQAEVRRLLGRDDVGARQGLKPAACEASQFCSSDARNFSVWMEQDHELTKKALATKRGRGPNSLS